MIPTEEKVEAIIAMSVVQLRADLGLPILEETSASTVLYGEGSDLDSMAIVHLIVDVEQRLQQAFGKSWILADERALSRKRSPFASISSMTQFILETTPQ